MKIGIMQPYFFPYIGYFQLLNMVDKYVVYDSLSFSNNKWGYRNRILINGAPGYFRVNILKASQNKRFNEISVSNDTEAKKKIFIHWNMLMQKHLIFRKSCLCWNSS